VNGLLAFVSASDLTTSDSTFSHALTPFYHIPTPFILASIAGVRGVMEISSSAEEIRVESWASRSILSSERSAYVLSVIVEIVQLMRFQSFFTMV